MDSRAASAEWMIVLFSYVGLLVLTAAALLIAVLLLAVMLHRSLRRDALAVAGAMLFGGIVGSAWYPVVVAPVHYVLGLPSARALMSFHLWTVLLLFGGGSGVGGAVGLILAVDGILARRRAGKAPRRPRVRPESG